MLELQADCYRRRLGGARTATGWIPAISQEGMTAAKAIGDDTLQKEMQGRVVPDSFTHGTSEQRMTWLKRGIDSGDPAQCDTFAGALAAEAFGTEEALPLKKMTRKEFPEGISPRVGLIFQAKGPNGEAVNFKVISTTADEVSVRLLHPLVGRDLEFKVKVLSVTDPRFPAAAPPLPPGVVELELDEISDA